MNFARVKLWFDVGIKRYTTIDFTTNMVWGLWFDVGIKRYTTGNSFHNPGNRCGLM